MLTQEHVFIILYFSVSGHVEEMIGKDFVVQVMPITLHPGQISEHSVIENAGEIEA